MKVILDSGHILHIRWHHDFLKKLNIEAIRRDKTGNIITNEDGSVKTRMIRMREANDRNKRFTHCFIYLGEEVNDDTMIASATVKCHHLDEYNKCQGRILSLTHALRAVDDGPEITLLLNKSDRKQIWMQYFKETKCNPNLKKMVNEVKEPDFTMQD